MNVFCVRRDLKPVKLPDRKKVELITYYLKEHIISVDPDDSGNFQREFKPAIYSKVLLNEQINSFKSDVDLKTLIGRINSQQEYNELVNQIGLPKDDTFLDSRPFEGLTDLTAEKILKRGKEAWEALPVELKNGQSEEEFLRTFTAEKLNAYAQKILAETEKSKSTKKEEVK